MARDSSLKDKIRKMTYNILRWGERKLVPGIRSIVGALFMTGGVFGFLPVLGFWMIPLGAAFIALDIPWTRHHIHSWMDQLEHEIASAEQRGDENRR